ncbi:MAG: SEC-C domain-containing protein [Myxococcota bacterium]
MDFEISENIGRNDPCPCGSGKKYKKCHMRLLRLQKEAKKKSRTIDEVVDSSTVPWTFFKLLGQINANKLTALFYESTHELGPWRERYPTLDSFLTALDEGSEPLPAADTYDLRRYRLDDPDTTLLLAAKSDARYNHIDYQILTLRPNELDAEGNPRDVAHRGFRIWDVRQAQLPKADVADDGDVHLDALGVGWTPKEFVPSPKRGAGEEE